MLPRVPKLCRRKAGGHVYCYVTDPATNQQVPMGRADDPATADNYEAWRREFLSRHRDGTARVAAHPGLTLAELVNAHDRWAEGYYRKRDKPTSELNNFRQTHRFLKPFFRVPARDFRPSQLKAVRQSMVGAGLARNHVNEQVNRVRRIVKWGVSNELVPVETLAALQTVAPLARGRTEAREEEPVRPVTEADFRAVLPYLPAPLRAAAELQWFTGMRSGEVLQMRPADVDRTGDVWQYRPRSHKTEHHGESLPVLLSAAAQAVLMPWLLRAAESNCFRPVEAAVARAPGHGRRRDSRTPGEQYHPTTYARAVARACRRAGVPRWWPHRLRHAAATRFAAAADPEIARILLRHRDLGATRRYVEEQLSKAADALRKIG